jgi:hypothetical protein
MKTNPSPSTPKSCCEKHGWHCEYSEFEYCCLNCSNQQLSPKDCCGECSSYPMKPEGNKDYSKRVCVSPDCPCHKGSKEERIPENLTAKNYVRVMEHLESEKPTSFDVSPSHTEGSWAVEFDSLVNELRAEIVERNGFCSAVHKFGYKARVADEQFIVTDWGNVKNFIQNLLSRTTDRVRGEISIDENTSDGYHTFKELYDHRITLYITLARNYADTHFPSEVWRSKLHHDGSSFEGWFILGIFKEAGNQITYHLPLSRWEETNFAATLEKAPEWDKHTPQDILERLKRLGSYPTT